MCKQLNLLLGPGNKANKGSKVKKKIMKDTELFLVNPSKVLMAYIEWLLSAKLNLIICADKERVVRAGCNASQGPLIWFL